MACPLTALEAESLPVHLALGPESLPVDLTLASLVLVAMGMVLADIVASSVRSLKNAKPGVLSCTRL